MKISCDSSVKSLSDSILYYNDGYGKEFAKTKELDQKFHRWLRAGFDARISGDYDVDTNITSQFVSDMINQAREFLETAQEYLKKSEA